MKTAQPLEAQVLPGRDAAGVIVSYTEAERLAALEAYDILDTPPETAYDDIAKLAAQICDMPISVVNLIDHDRQWFKAKTGLTVSETPLDVSICVHGLLEDDVFVVEDVQKDPRFANNPLVVGQPGLRAYSGAVLKTPEGIPLGMLCVLDTKPRKLSAAQLFALKTLAAQVITTMELRKTVDRLEQQNEALADFSQHVAHDLRSPLATITALLDIYIGRYAVGSEGKAKAILDGVMQSAARMRTLITDLLTLATVGRIETLTQAYDPNHTFRDTVENLQSLIDTTDARVTSDALPHVAMTQSEFGQVLQNLIGNALNYRDQARAPVIHVSSETVGGSVKISVADNGIGIPRDSMDRIFQPLERLHGEDRPGTGLGLSIVKKIISQRDGALVVKSVPGQGTVFSFTLPAA